MRVMQVLLGVVVGLLVGALASVVHPGPVDLPWVGLVIASLLVGSGAWFILEWGKPAAWFGYLLGIVGVTFWILLAPPANDIVTAVPRWASEAWLLLAPVSALAPSALVRRARVADDGE